MTRVVFVVDQVSLKETVIATETYLTNVELVAETIQLVSTVVVF